MAEQSKPFTFRLHPVKDKAVWDEITQQQQQGYELRELVTDRFLRYLGVKPEMFHQNARAVTVADLETLLGEAVNTLDRPMHEILEAMTSYQQELTSFMESQRQLTHNLFQQLAAGEITVEDATQVFDSETDDYATRIIKSIDSRYSD